MLRQTSNFHLSLVLGQATHINDRQQEARFRMDHLHGLALVEMEGCAQAFMARHKRLHALFERSRVDMPLKSLYIRDDIGAASWFQLMEKPEALLGEGERKPLWAHHRLQS